MEKDKIHIKEIRVHRMRMKLRNSFTTSFGSLSEREFFIIEAIGQGGVSGYGESVAFASPWYTEETVKTVEHMMESFLIPLIFQTPFTHPDEVADRFRVVKGNPMAKGALEGALWDLYAKQRNRPLREMIGGVRTEVEVGVSIGIQPSMKKLLNQIEAYLEEGYRRIKLKIKPGYDIDVLKQVRAVFPHVPLMVDANSAYTLKDVDRLKQLDEYQLIMIEQPFREKEFLEHAKLQKQLDTPICLDESIHSVHDAELAVSLGSCKIINVKIGRVGGISAALQIHRFSKEKNIPLWCGGMLESGVGRAHNIALASLEQFLLPGDISASNRYWEEDLVEPEITHNRGRIPVPDSPGIGFEIPIHRLEKYRVEVKSFKNPNG